MLLLECFMGSPNKSVLHGAPFTLTGALKTPGPLLHFCSGMANTQGGEATYHLTQNSHPDLLPTSGMIRPKAFPFLLRNVCHQLQWVGELICTDV